MPHTRRSHYEKAHRLHTISALIPRHCFVHRVVPPIVFAWLSAADELLTEDGPSNLDELSRLEELVAESLRDLVHLNPNEIPVLEELLEAADAVGRETKIQHILEVVDKSFSARSVLFFTEYKATQA